MSNEKLEVAIVEDGSGTKQLIEAVNKLAAGIDDLGLRAKKGSSEIKSQGDAAKKSAGDNDYLTKALGGARSAFSGLSGALAGVTSLLSVSKLVEYADKYTSMSGKLRLVTTDQNKLNDIIEQAYGIAQRNSTSLVSTTELYGKLSGTVQALGGNQKDVAGLTETVTQAIALTGATAEEAENGLRQFNQGLSSGALRGEEFNSVLENIPGLAKAIAAGIGTSGAITTGELRKMAEEGKLTGKAITDALKKVAPDIANLAAGLPDTVSKAMTRLDNAFLKFIGQSNQAFGVTQVLAKGIGLIANNINIVVPLLLAFTAILAAGAFASAIGALSGIATGFVTLAGAVGTATIAMLSNPLILAGTLVAIAAVTAAVKLSGQSFGELASKVGTGAQGLALGVAKALGLTAALSGVPGAATAATAATQANGNANTVAAAAQTAHTAAVTAAAPAQAGFLSGLVAQAAAVNNSIAAKTADTTVTTANTAAKTAAVPAQAAVNKSVFEGIDAQTRVGQAIRLHTLQQQALAASGAPAAAAINSVGNAGTTTANSLTTANNGVLTVRNGFESLSGAGVKASGSFGTVSQAAAGALPGFASVTKAANDTGAGFLEVSMRANTIAPSVQKMGTAVAATTPQVTALKDATKLSAQELASIVSAMDGTTPSLAALGNGTGEAQVKALELAKANGELAKSFGGVSDAAAKSLENITANAKAAEESSKGAKEFADRLEKLSGNYNQLGEKLETYEQRVARVSAAEKQHSDYLNSLIDKLKGADTSASSLSGSYQSLGVVTSGVLPILGTLNTVLNDNASEFYSAAGGVNSYSDALRQSVIAAADATAAYNKERAARATESGYNANLKNTIRNASGNVDGGQFQYQDSGYEIMFKGGVVGSFQTGYAGYGQDANLPARGYYKNAQEIAQKAVDDAYALNPSLRSTEAAEIARKAVDRASANDVGTAGTWYRRAFAHGGEFKVGGNGGTDSQPVSFMASPNETVTVETPAQRNKRLRADQANTNVPTQSQSQRPGVFIMNVRTNDVDSFKRTRTQIGQDFVRRLNK